MGSHCHVLESQGSALREVEQQDSSHRLEIEQSTLPEEVVCSSSLASQQCTFLKVEGQGCDYVPEKQLSTSLEIQGCSFLEVEEKEKRLRQYEVIGSDEPPKPKGKRPPRAKERIRQQDKAFPHSASGYSPTDDLYLVQQQFQPNHGLSVPLNEPHLPSQPSAESLSFIGYSSTYESHSTSRKSQLKHVVHPYEPHLPSQPSVLFGSHRERIQGHSMSAFSSNPMSRTQQQFRYLNTPLSLSDSCHPSLRSFQDPTLLSYSRSHEPGNSRSREPGNSRFRESGNSKSCESGNSRSRKSVTSRSREPGNSRSHESETSRSHKSVTSRPCESGNSRSRESGNSRSRESGNSKSRESGNSRSRESGNSRESNQHESKHQRKHERTQGAIKEAIKQNAMSEAPYMVEALVKSIQSSYNKGQLDMTEGKEQLLSSGKSLLWAAAEAYCRSESSPEVIRKLSSALDKCSLARWLPPQLKPLANLISLNNIKRVLEILKCMYDGKMSRVDACKQILDMVGGSVLQYYGCYFGGLVGGILGGAIGGPCGAAIGAIVGAWVGEKLGKSLWELIKEAIGYIINYIWSLLN